MKSGIILQYIDDLLITSNSCEDCLLNTITVLNNLAKRWYKFTSQGPDLQIGDGIPGTPTETGH